MFNREQISRLAEHYLEMTPVFQDDGYLSHYEHKLGGRVYDFNPVEDIQDAEILMTAVGEPFSIKLLNDGRFQAEQNGDIVAAMSICEAITMLAMRLYQSRKHE